MAIPESGSIVLTLFEQLVDRVKSSQPIKTDGKSLTLGFVYSQMPIGMMVDRNAFSAPWSPMGGATLQDVAAAKQPASASSSTASAAAPAPSKQDKIAKAMQSAFLVSQLVDRMLMVSKDNQYLEYPTERKVSFAYEGIISGMQSMPTPPMAPEIENRINEARKILYELDDQGDIVGKSKLYKRYVKNASDYALAKKQYSDAQAKALADPVAAETFPQDSVFFQNQVDQAWDTLKTEGAEKIERALSIIESVGVSIQEKIIAKARKVYDAWNLGLAGDPTTTPYSFVSPQNWSDPSDDSEGWTRLQITKKEYHHHTATASTNAGAGGSLFLGFINTAATGGYDRTNNQFKNDSSGLTVDMEYGIVTITRPWCIGDLFYLKNWYLVNALKNAISNGTVDGQNDSLLPMIPMQFLCVRNVKITAEDWKTDGQVISSKKNASGGFSLGFLNIGGKAGKTETQSDSNWSFDGSTLSINGTQIIAWLSEIVPACAPMDDPNVKPADKK